MRITGSLALLAVLSATPRIAKATSLYYNGTSPNSTAPIFPLSSDPEFSFVLTEALALANGGGAATSEVLRAASQIAPGDAESWYREFYWLATRVHNISSSSSATTSAGVVSRREALFRASSYYRLSSMFLVGDPSDPRLYDSWDLALAGFHEAISLLDVPGEPFALQAEAGFTVPGYFFRPDPELPVPGRPLENSNNDNSTKPPNRRQKRPTIIIGSGYDAPQEDSYHALGLEALARGFNVVLYEGPGQNTVRRQQGLGFIPNWWDVVAPVLDSISSRDDVDTDNLVLVGLSFGAQLAPRAASRLHYDDDDDDNDNNTNNNNNNNSSSSKTNRLRAVISIDGLHDMQAAVLDQYPASLRDLFLSGNATAFDAAMAAALQQYGDNTQFTWVAAQGLWAFATDSYYEWLEKLGRCAVTEEMVGEIGRGPPGAGKGDEEGDGGQVVRGWVGKGQDDTLVDGQEETLVRFWREGAGQEPGYHLFETDVGAGLHCQLGAEPYLAQVVFDWVQSVLV